MLGYLFDPYLDIILICNIPLILTNIWGARRWMKRQERRIRHLEEKPKLDPKFKAELEQLLAKLEKEKA